MDGGIFPWRLQKLNILKYLTAESYGKPLPPPPIGYIWEKKADRNWELQNVASNRKANNVASTEKSQKVTEDEDQQYLSNEIEHIVMPNDTLQGLCLHYRVSAMQVRRLNMFSGNNIQFKKTLRIPLDSSTTGGAEVVRQIETPEVLIQKFKNATNEMTPEARSYLEYANWNFQAALSLWEEDSRWESKAVASSTIQQQPQISKFLHIEEEEEEVDCNNMEVAGRFVSPVEVIAAVTPCTATLPYDYMVAIPPAAVQYDPPVVVDKRREQDYEPDEADMILARPHESACMIPLLG